MTDALPRQFDVSARLRQVFAIDPEEPAIQHRGRWTSWGRLRELGEQAQALLQREGAGGPDGPGRHGVIMRNTPSVCAVAMSIFDSRQTLVTLSHMQPPAVLASELGRLDLSSVIAHEEDWRHPELREAVARAGLTPITLGPAAADPASAGSAPRLLGGRVSARPSAAPAAPATTGVAVVMLTSGTTGVPKRVPLSYESFEASFANAAHYASTGDQERPRLRSGVAILSSSLLHVAGLWRLLLNLLDGRRVALMERFSVDEWVALVVEHRPKAASIPPAAVRMVLDAQVPREALSSLKAIMCGTAPLSPDLADAFFDAYGVPLLVIYGATEFNGGIAGWTLADYGRHWRAKRGSVGRIHSGVEVRVVDPSTGEALSPGAVGLLEARSRQITSTRPDGWVRTNDLARLDDDGFLWLEGRADDVIIRGGFKISTGAVAEILKEHPAVRDAAVVGMPDERLGEVPVAAIELAGDGDLSVDELLSWSREHLTPYQIPTRVVVVPELPRTPSLKVSQPLVRELLAEYAYDA
jgi:long-chain acyl-CoA synthetase